ncbi:hypothetical protein Zmor_025016 [Zophobas morio]|uniref:Mitochondrial transcription rescue factor 1 C-terminal domain-containing protein n=2 Tax=Zophobas morio TaxID=2755281 RepID=A0AA38HQS4_9CUCU|nr:hypothetical protein Zmor_025016 [Zophobas morio]
MSLHRFSKNIFSSFLTTACNKSFSNMCCATQLPLLNAITNTQETSLRYKSKKSKKQSQAPSDSEETGEESTWDDKVVDKNSKVMNITVNSTRIDAILKSGLGIARNKIETFFYESKIRLNGKKLLKKSDLAQEGDEIDVVKGASVTNPNFLTVARVEVLGVTDKGETVSVKIRRCKNLAVEKYEDYMS